MKFAADALLGIIACVRKGLTEGIDVSALLRDMEFILTPDGNLSLDPKNDLWKMKDDDKWESWES